MRLVLISDTHGQHEQLSQLAPLPEGDVLIHAGDFMRTGRLSQELAEFVMWFWAQPHEHKLFIAGNHDLWMEERGLASIDSPYTTYLQDSGCEISGLRFWGSPWTTRFQDWAFMSERGAAMRAHWDLIPTDTDVLITHGPPQGVLDSLPAYGPDLGCADLRAAVLRIQPRLHVFGHIHFGYGQQRLGETLCVNAAQLDDAYRLKNLPVVVDL